MKFTNTILFLLIAFIVTGCCCPPDEQAPPLDPENNRREAYVDNNPQLTLEVRDAILRGTIVPRMTTEDVRASWGEPHDVKTSRTSEGNFAEWTYFRSDKNVKLHFHKDKLKTWK